MTTDMGAGPELDKLVAEALNPDDELVRGRIVHLRVSTDQALAVDALEVWREQHPDWTGRISLPRRNWSAGKEHRVQLWRQASFNDSVIMACAPTLAEAICKAIVLAGREVQE